MRITARIKQGGSHFYLSVWVNGGLITDKPYGLCIRNEELTEFLEWLQPDKVDWDEVEK
jgi:hypothetical protein